LISMDAIRPFLDFLSEHTFEMVFLVTFIDAFGLPFPGRLLLIVSGAFMANGADAAVLILIAASGALLGDHGVYLAGRIAGSRILGLLCRVTLNSEGCLEKTREYLRRFGAPTFVLGRFVAGIRIVAITLAGAGLVRYRTFLLYDVAGVLVWASTCVLLGYAVRDHWMAFVEAYGSTPLLATLLTGSVVGAVLLRVWWRARWRALRAG
jgi:membrane protein DedA with SNARE-associated domain